MNKDLERWIRDEMAVRPTPVDVVPVNVAAGMGGIPTGAQVHIHYHQAPQVVAPADDPAKRTTMDNGVLAWFMPYFVIGLLAFILCGSVVGLIMALAVVLMGLVVTLVQALAMGLLLAGVSVLVAGFGVQKMRAPKDSKTK